MLFFDQLPLSQRQM